MILVNLKQPITIRDATDIYATASVFRATRGTVDHNQRVVVYMVDAIFLPTLQHMQRWQALPAKVTFSQDIIAATQEI